MIDQTLAQALQKEIPILTAQIRSLYAEFDTRGSYHEKEHFHFSLLFIGYAVKNPLKKEDRLDLYKHEYAHYMQHNFHIPQEYQWQHGTHGSAWKYCCSLTGAAPTPYYKAGEALMKHDYEKKLRSPIHDRTVTVRDTYRRK